MGGALDDVQIIERLKEHAGASVIELDEVVGKFCGFREPKENAVFLMESQRVLTYDRVPFCTMEGSNNAPLYSRCCTPWHEGEKFFPCTYGFGAVADLPKCGV